MVLLDTDHLSIMDEDTLEAFTLGRRLAALPSEQVAVSIVTYEEQMRGWLAYLARANSLERQVEAYRRLRAHVARFQKIPMVDFDQSAATQFDRLRQMRICIGTMDMKIAAIALANDMTLPTRNMSDFGKVPGLRAEDWTT